MSFRKELTNYVQVDDPISRNLLQFKNEIALESNLTLQTCCHSNHWASTKHLALLKAYLIWKLGAGTKVSVIYVNVETRRFVISIWPSRDTIGMTKSIDIWLYLERFNQSIRFNRSIMDNARQLRVQESTFPYTRSIAPAAYCPPAWRGD